MTHIQRDGHPALVLWVIRRFLTIVKPIPFLGTPLISEGKGTYTSV